MTLHEGKEQVRTPQIRDIVRTVSLEIRSRIIESQASALANDALDVYTKAIENAVNAVEYNPKKADAYKLAEIAHTIAKIANDPDRQYQIRHGDQWDAFPGQRPDKPTVKANGFIIRSDSSAIISTDFHPKRKHKHSAEVLTRALAKMLPVIDPDNFGKITADQTMHVDLDPQYSYSFSTSVFHTPLNPSLTLKTALYPEVGYSGTRRTKLTAKHMEVTFSLGVHDPQGMLEKRYEQSSTEFHMREIDRSLKIHALEDNLNISDPNAKKDTHVMYIPIPHGYTREHVIQSLEKRSKRKWMRLGTSDEYVDSTGNYKLLLSQKIFTSDGNQAQFLEATVSESKTRHEARFQMRQEQLRDEAKKTLFHKLYRATEKNPVILTKNKKHTKTVYDMPLSAPLRLRPKHEYSRDPIYNSRRFDDVSTKTELQIQFPIPKQVRQALESQQKSGIFTEQRFPPTPVQINGKDMQLIYVIRPSTKATSAVIECYRYRGEDIEVFASK